MKKMGIINSLFSSNSSKNKKNSSVIGRINELEESLNRFRLLLTHLSTPVFAVEPNGSIFFYSEGASTFLGLPAEQVLGRLFSIVLPLEPKDQIKNTFLQFIERREIYKLEVTLKDKPVQLVLNPILEPETQRFLGGLVEMNDLTQEKKLQQKQVDFVSFVSHELRTPISIIKGYLDVVIKEATYMQPEHLEFIQRAYISNQRQEQTVEKLLDMSQIETGNVTVNVQKLNLDYIVREVQRTWEERAAKKGLQLLFVMPRFPIPPIRGDEDLVRSVFDNLIENAIKYTERGSITVQMWFDEGYVTISVKDTGPGISQELQSQLFAKFLRGERSLTETTQGAGLGLYLSKQFIQLMGGQMSLISEVGKGSEFRFSLPAFVENH
ncbi:HAMP domain-containing histidine kinase [candidate division WWE3 bacterium]|nr:HAMP domain-containing histidine kinase [candidate division WWE3 bacterium]